MAVLLAEVSVIRAIEMAAILIHWLAFAGHFIHLHTKELWALSVAAVSLWLALAESLMPVGILWAVLLHALTIVHWFALAHVFVEPETEEIRALLIAGLVHWNAVAPLFVKEGAWWAFVDLAPVVGHWHALALVEVGADHLLCWAVQVALLVQDALAGKFVELGTSWAVDLWAVVVLKWDTLTFVEVGSHTIRLKALNIAVVDAIAGALVPVGVHWAVSDVVTEHWITLASIEINCHTIRALHKALLFHDTTTIF